MQPIDFTFRYDPRNPERSDGPATPEEARRIMEDGNHLFAQWTESCQDELDESLRERRSFIVPCDVLDLGLADQPGDVAPQSPFAVLLGCSDARVPTELIFAQVRNNLFVVRVAGNVLATECLGSIEYAVHAMSHSLRIALVLGHTNCGAVFAAVDTYLKPWGYLERIPSPAVRAIVDRILVPVRKSAKLLDSILGSGASELPQYRQALGQTSVFVNAVQGAYNLRQALLQEGTTGVGVYYGVFDLATHRIWSLPQPEPCDADVEARLAEAPDSIEQFEEVATRMAKRIAGRAIGPT